MTSLARHELRRAGGRRLLVYGALRGALAAEELPASAPAAAQQRLDVLTDTWMAISPGRNARPSRPSQPSADGAGPAAACPLCPGGPEVPFSYEAAVFENRWPSLLEDPPAVQRDPRVAAATGRCEVVLYTSAHEGSIATLPPTELARVISIWRDRTIELLGDTRHAFVLVFENRGGDVGATISHPHGQIYAFDHVPQLVGRRVAAVHAHRAAHGTCLHCVVVADDEAAEGRRVFANDSFTVGVPFAPRWPYEVHVRARRHGVRRLSDLRAREGRDLAAALHALVRRYDGLFGFELPYMMVVQQAPDACDDWHLSVEFSPVHRAADLLKVRASVETATGLFIIDVLPEDAAARLAELALPPDHWRPVDVPEVVHAGESGPKLAR